MTCFSLESIGFPNLLFYSKLLQYRDIGLQILKMKETCQLLNQ